MEYSDTSSRIGFSTGALAYSNFHLAIQMLLRQRIPVVEISALRFSEWLPLTQALATLDLSGFEFVSFHLPSVMTVEEETVVLRSLEKWKGGPLILHPDAITDWGAWRNFGPQLCIENMDKRKPIGRTDRELTDIFDKLPDASMCFDLGHAWQVDPTMGEAYWILKGFSNRIKQLHVSEVNSRSKHDTLSYLTIQSFREVAHLIPPGVPLVLETPVDEQGMLREISKARFALLPATGTSGFERDAAANPGKPVHATGWRGLSSIRSPAKQ
jgi:hypothetical protein